MVRSPLASLAVVILSAFGLWLCTAHALNAQTKSDGRGKVAAKPKRGYTISRETTYFTGPLKADGTIDFVAAVNEHFSKGVTPENNAARDIIPLLDVLDFGTPPTELRDPILRSLGLDPADHPVGKTFRDVGSYFNRSQNEIEEFNKWYDEALERPWTARELPEVAKWLDANEAVFTKISAATRKSQYFVPFTVSDDTDSLIQILLPDVQTTRSQARAYAVRVNRRIGEGDWAGAWSDILTIQRLGRHVGHGKTLIEGLVGVAITSIACKSAKQFVMNADAKAVDWEQFQNSWDVETITRLDDSLGISERAMLIQMACKISDNPDAATADLEQIGFIPPEFRSILPNKVFVRTLRDMLQSGEVPLDEALRYSNEIYDRAIEISFMADPQKRENAFEQLQKQLVDGKSNGETSLAQVFLTKGEEPSKQFAKALLGMMFPAVDAVNRAEWRVEASQQVIELALAARVLQSQTGHLPGSLRELEPWVERSVMTQPSTGDPIAVQSDGDGILMYHWSSDRVDDGGDIDGEQSKDWGIRIAK